MIHVVGFLLIRSLPCSHLLVYYSVPSGVFSVGFPFNYWSEYKWVQLFHLLAIGSYDTNKPDEYCIKPRYNNFKEEIQNYQHINFKKQFENEV